MELASIVASFVSVIVGFLAIALSAYFYTQAKGAEREVSNALASIQMQVNALQSLTGRWMDRLTKYATQPRHEQQDTSLFFVLSELRELPGSIASQLRNPEPDAQVPALRNELLRAYIVCVFYAAIANAFTQGHLPSLADLTTDDPIKRLVDQSNADFQILEALIAGYETREVQSCPIRNLYDDALRWKPVVRDSAMVYQTRQREA